MRQDPKQEDSYLKKFVRDLENLNLDPQGLDVNLKSITQNLVKDNLASFTFVIAGPSHLNERKIERIYSKNEIKKLVCTHLISEYQNDTIINAVTEYLYGVHVGK